MNSPRCGDLERDQFAEYRGTFGSKVFMRLMNTKSVAEMTAVPEGTLRYWRIAGIGPPWVKLEGSIRYVEEEVLEYIRLNRRTPSVRAYVEEKNVV